MVNLENTSIYPLFKYLFRSFFMGTVPIGKL